MRRKTKIVGPERQRKQHLLLHPSCITAVGLRYCWQRRQSAENNLERELRLKRKASRIVRYLSFDYTKDLFQEKQCYPERNRMTFGDELLFLKLDETSIEIKKSDE